MYIGSPVVFSKMGWCSESDVTGFGNGCDEQHFLPGNPAYSLRNSVRFRRRQKQFPNKDERKPSIILARIPEQHFLHFVTSNLELSCTCSLPLFGSASGQNLATFANPSQVVRKFAKKPKRSLEGVAKNLRTNPYNNLIFNKIEVVTSSLRKFSFIL